MSGVATYLRALAQRAPDVRLLSLNDGTTGAALPNETRLPPEASHDPQKICAAVLASVAETAGGPIVIAPGVGDTVHYGAALAAKTLSQSGSKVCLLGTAHSDDANQYRVLEAFRGWLGAQIGVNRAVADKLARQSAVPTAYLPYPVDSGAPLSRAALDGTKPLALLYAGRFDEDQKRVSRLPQLTHALRSLGVPFHLSLVGAGVEEARLRSGFAQAQTAACVDFLPPRTPDEMPTLYAEHDVILLTSDFEGTPLALIEAMGRRVCPAILGFPGAGEIVREGEEGCVVPPRAVEALAVAIAALHAERPRLEALKDAALRKASSTFGWEEHLRRLREIVSVASNRGVPENTEPPDLARADIEALVAEGADATVAVMGAGVFGRRVVDGLLAARARVVALADSGSPGLASYRGAPVIPPKVLPDYRPEAVVIGSAAYVGDMERAVLAAYAARKIAAPRMVALVSGRTAPIYK